MTSSRPWLLPIIAGAMLLSSFSIDAQQAARAASDTAIIPVVRQPSPGFSNGTSSASRSSRLAPRPTARQRTPITEAEILSGVNLSDEQKASVDRIHHETRAKMEIVSKDGNESPEQKAAMIEGMNRIQLRQVFDVLKPEQQEQVRKKILAMRSANHSEEKTSSEQKSR